MKYVLTWNERSQGSAIEYENAQKRILEVFTQWKAPNNFKIEMFVIRVGEWGGHMLVDCDDPLEIHKLSTTLCAFEFQARPVIPIEDAVRVRTRSDGLARRTKNARDLSKDHTTFPWCKPANTGVGGCNASET